MFDSCWDNCPLNSSVAEAVIVGRLVEFADVAACRAVATWVESARTAVSSTASSVEWETCSKVTNNMYSVFDRKNNWHRTKVVEGHEMIKCLVYY